MKRMDALRVLLKHRTDEPLVVSDGDGSAVAGMSMLRTIANPVVIQFPRQVLWRDPE